MISIRSMLVFALVICFCTGVPLLAQDGDGKEGTVRGTVEIGAYTGGAFHLQGALAVVCTSSGCVSQDSGTAHPVIGGQAGVAAARWLWVMSDFSYIPLGSATATSRGLTSNVSGSAATFHGALEFQPNLKRVAPFASIGWGVVRQSVEGSLLGATENLSGSLFSGQVGGGARVYLSDRWGLKAGFYGISVQINDTGNISTDYARFGTLKAGVFFHTK